MTLFEALTGGAFDRLNWQHSGEFDQNFSKKSNARGFALGGARGMGGFGIDRYSNKSGFFHSISFLFCVHLGGALSSSTVIYFQVTLILTGYLALLASMVISGSQHPIFYYLHFFSVGTRERESTDKDSCCCNTRPAELTSVYLFYIPPCWKYIDCTSSPLNSIPFK